jgi:hypothetical protein
LSKIFLDDPKALEKCLAKLEDLEKQRAYWKTVKKTVPRDYSNTEGDRKWYMPQNINANIRSVKEKIEKIQSLQKDNVELERVAFWHEGIKMFKYVKKGMSKND